MKVTATITCFIKKCKTSQRKLVFCCCNFGHYKKVKTIKKHKNFITRQNVFFKVSIRSGFTYFPCLPSNPVSKSPVKIPYIQVKLTALTNFERSTDTKGKPFFQGCSKNIGLVGLISFKFRSTNSYLIICSCIE